MEKFQFTAGVLIGAAWAFVNFLLFIDILKIAILKKSKEKLFLVLMLKFPVLYLAGFLILISGCFPVWSLLSGFTIVLFYKGVISIWPKSM